MKTKPTFSFNTRNRSSLEDSSNDLNSKASNFLEKQNWYPIITKQSFETFLSQNNSTLEEALLAFATACQHFASHTPISNYKVGAVVRSSSGNIYCGANSEFTSVSLSNTIHAEQSAVFNAFMNNENQLTHLAVNEPPCGYCRQFLNELSNANSFLIIIKDDNNNIITKPLQDHYLPFSFGPKNLGNSTGMLDSPPFTYTQNTHKNDSLFQKTFHSMNKSYAPYSFIPSAIGLQFFDGSQISASYIENAAYNPSLHPMIGALNLSILFNKNISDIEKIYLLETDITSDSQKNISSLPTTLQLLNSINFTNDFRFILI